MLHVSLVGKEARRRDKQVSIYDKIGCVSATVTVLCMLPFVWPCSASAEDKPKTEKEVKKEEKPVSDEDKAETDPTRFRYTRPKNAVDGC